MSAPLAPPCPIYQPYIAFNTKICMYSIEKYLLAVNTWFTIHRGVHPQASLQNPRHSALFAYLWFIHRLKLDPCLWKYENIEINKNDQSLAASHRVVEMRLDQMLIITVVTITAIWPYTMCYCCFSFRDGTTKIHEAVLISQGPLHSKQLRESLIPSILIAEAEFLTIFIKKLYTVLH